jgi:hypothetical protein
VDTEIAAREAQHATARTSLHTRLALDLKRKAGGGNHPAPVKRVEALAHAVLTAYVEDGAPSSERNIATFFDAWCALPANAELAAAGKQLSAQRDARAALVAGDADGGGADASAAGGGGADADARAAGGLPAARRSEITRKILHGLAYNFAPMKDGTCTVTVVTCNGLMKLAKDRLNHHLPYATAGRYVKTANDAEAKERPTRPAVADAAADAQQPLALAGAGAEAAPAGGAAEPGAGHGALGHESDAASDVDPADEAVGAAALAAAVTWPPSRTWCYWFLHTHMGLVIRRITSARIPPDCMIVQQRVHDANVRLVGAYLYGGLRTKFVMGSDEFGAHLFPQGEYRWDTMCARRTERSSKKDKRAYTGNRR